MIVVAVDPMGAPRQTRADVWKKRPVILRYRAYRDFLRLHIKEVPQTVSLKFTLSMPDSWTHKKRGLMVGMPHQQKPDIDNLIKGVLDALLVDDAHIHTVLASKVWGTRGLISMDSLGGNMEPLRPLRVAGIGG